VLIDTIICLGVAAYSIFTARFYTLLSDFSVFIGLIVAGLAYFVLARGHVTAEAAATPEVAN
jgi:hypothetical protein